jgi:endonuclease III
MGKMDKIFERLNSIDNTLAAQHETLKEHIRRTELLEKTIEPLKEQSSMVVGVFKFLGFLILAIGALEGLKHVL